MTSTIRWDYDWAAEYDPATRFVSDFIAVDGLDRAVRLSVGCGETLLARQVSCLVNSRGLARFGLKVEAVICTDDDQHEFQLCCPAEDGQVFVAEFNLGRTSIALLPDCWTTDEMTALSFSFSFRLHLTGTVDGFRPVHFDPHVGRRLWEAASHRKGTDVEFQVGRQTLAAHKFVLAARCPVFRAMFASGMIECSTGAVVNIVDADPDIFRQFLHFLYTGQLAGPVGHELGTLADRYLDDTLTALCRAAPADADDDDDCDSAAGRFEIRLPGQAILRDAAYSDQLWSATVDGHLTDVEFRLPGGRIFPSHRALLAANCPALLDGPDLDEIDPAEFQELLYFLTTGALKPDGSARLDGLLRRFQVT